MKPTSVGERLGRAVGAACRDVEGWETGMAAPVSLRRWLGLSLRPAAATFIAKSGMS